MRVALYLGLDRDPPHLAVVRTNDTVFSVVVAHVAFDGVDELPLGPFPILGMDAPHPVFVGLGGSFRWQAVDRQILGRAAVAKAVAQEDFHAADLADLLDARKVRFAVAQRALDANLIVDVGVGADPAHDVAGSVADRHGARQVPAIGAGRIAQAKLDLVVGAFAHRHAPCGDGPIEILGVNHCAPAVAVELAYRGARVFVHLVIEPIEFAIRRCRPNVVRHDGGERAELGLAFAQRLLGAYPVGRLDHDRKHARRLAALVEQRAVVEIDPQILRPARADKEPGARRGKTVFRRAGRLPSPGG